MKCKGIVSIILILVLTACASTTQKVVSDEVVFYGEGNYWNVSYIYNPILYKEKKVNWVEIELKDLKLSREDINNIDIELEGDDGVITGNVEDMKTNVEGNTISFLVGTVNNETYEDDAYRITIKFKGKQDNIKLIKK
ncbi:hypothetical protein CSV80_06370 [Sporosarcina sp. P12(2017)]|uniref:hypothetical protein n=1 Tax=unclassified Sporosarcina TaxID=2647733 RepID=UPI000C16D696|nr:MULTISPECIES: hypothetical protein [unclassified Sporosarcina]PIC57929.1 hypothetical protein CSV81_06515 [Sporosarcina sp. P10]PIC61312.1 hypothetical protein CSV80_06370 [Sporosarcina sp. P12(2017)]